MADQNGRKLQILKDKIKGIPYIISYLLYVLLKELAQVE